MTKQTCILIVDDDPWLLRFVKANLEALHYRVVTAEESSTALELLAQESPDIIVLDIMLPGMDGYQLCQHIRTFSTVPVLMLTAKVEEQDKVKGLQLGADDYLTKPFGIPEFLARVEALLRRSKMSEATQSSFTVSCRDLTVDLLRRMVTVRGQEVNLTPTEYALLAELAANAGRVMLHQELLTKVWGPEYRGEVEYLRAYIRHLRQKLEKDPSHPQHILSRPGTGYMLFKPSDPA